MVKRTYTVRRRVGRRVGRPRKYKAPIYRKLGLKMPQTIHFKRWTSSKLMTLNGTAASAGASIEFNNAGSGTTILHTPAAIGVSYHALVLCFKFSDLPDVDELTHLFEEYKITGVLVKIIPVATVSTTQDYVASDSNAVNGWVHSVTEENDFGAPTASDVGIDAMRQMQDYRVRNIVNGKSISRYVKPKVLIAGYESGVPSAVFNSNGRWISTTNQGIYHYGMKYIFELYNNDNVARHMMFKTEACYYLTCRKFK